MKTTWLKQLTKGKRAAAFGLPSAWAIQVVVAGINRAAQAVPTLLAQLTIATSKLNISIIKRTPTAHTNNKQFTNSSFTDYSNPISRIRRPNLQVTGAS